MLTFWLIALFRLQIFASLTQTFGEFALQFVQSKIVIEDAPILVNEKHGWEGLDSKGSRQLAAFESPFIEELGPRYGIPVEVRFGLLP